MDQQSRGRRGQQFPGRDPTLGETVLQDVVVRIRESQAQVEWTGAVKECIYVPQELVDVLLRSSGLCDATVIGDYQAVLHEVPRNDRRGCCGERLELVLLVRITKVRDTSDHEPRNAGGPASGSEPVALHVKDFDL